MMKRRAGKEHQMITVMTQERTPKTPTTHGVSGAWYSNRGDGSQWAVMECLCGETITGQTDSWEDAGYELDIHILNHKKHE